MKKIRVRVRFATALLVVASINALAGCSSTAEDSSSTTLPSTTTTQLSQSESVATVDLGIDKDNRVEHTKSAELTIGRAYVLASQLEVAFDRPNFSLACLRAAHVRLYVAQSTGAESVEFGMYASRQFELGTLSDGAELGTETVLSNRPRATAMVSNPGWADWDVTSIARRWLSGEAMDGSPYLPPDAGPLVFTLIEIPTADAAAFSRTFTSVEGVPDQRPRIIWSSRAGCR